MALPVSWLVGLFGVLFSVSGCSTTSCWLPPKSRGAWSSATESRKLGVCSYDCRFEGTKVSGTWNFPAPAIVDREARQECAHKESWLRVSAHGLNLKSWERMSKAWRGTHFFTCRRSPVGLQDVIPHYRRKRIEFGGLACRQHSRNGLMISKDVRKWVLLRCRGHQQR